MKRFFALLLVLCLAACAALAETAIPVTLDFGDFTLTLDHSTPIDQAESREENTIWFTYFPDYDESAAMHPNVNCVWNSYCYDFSDMTAEDCMASARETMDGTVAALAAQGIAVSDVEILTAEVIDLSGKPSYAYIASYYADYSGMGIDIRTTLYIQQAYVSDPAFGTYVFTVTAQNMADVVKLAQTVDTIAFK